MASKRKLLQCALCLLIATALATCRAAATPGDIQRYNGLLANDRLSIRFDDFSVGCGRYAISAIGDDQRHMGVVRPFARVTYLSRRGEQEQVEFKPILESQTDSDRQATALLEQEITAGDGTRWRFRARFSLAAGELFARAEYSLSADRRVRLLHFRGPTLRAGEGSFGSAKDEALLPGLEYLLAGERSSSTLDVTTDAHLRVVPHPYKITVPLMAVQRDGLLAGLMWDASQTWDGRNRSLAAIFASPNFVDEEDNHLMALGVPPFPWAPENEWLAEEPYLLAPNHPLTLQFEILVRTAQHVVDSVDTWLALYGLPEVPAAPRPLPREIDLCLRSLLDTLWYDGEERYGWKPWTTHQAQPHLDPQMALLLALGGPLAANPRLAERAAARVAEVNDRAGWSAGTGNLDYAYRFGSILPSLRMARNGALAAIRTQKPDGSWRFEPEPGRELLGIPLEVLGERGEAAVGLTAGRATHLLRFARLTGNRDAEAAGLRAAEFMQRFVRPQASQVWECPVHAPDILASAQAADAYLEAYLITGDRTHLQRAIYWARTGLPFLYLWQAPDREIMPYCSIPIYGASLFYVSWFGRPVQWNGLAYAQVLRGLAEHDPGFDWMTVADGITVAGTQMQAERGPETGNYPDSYYVLDGKTMGGPWLRPDSLLPNVLAQAGRDVGARTTIVRTETGRLHISSAAEIADAGALEPGAMVTFGLGDPAPGTLAAVTVAGLRGPPDAVTYSGQVWPRLEPDELEDQEGWSFEDGILAIQARRGGRVMATYPELHFTLPSVPLTDPLHIELSPESALANEQTIVTAIIRNDSEIDLSGAALHVSLQAPDGWSVADPEQTLTPEHFPADATVTVAFRTRPPHGAAGGYSWLTAKAWAEPTESSQQFLTRGIAGRASVGVKVISPVQVEACQTRTIVREALATRLGLAVELANLRTRPIEGTLAIDPPEGWPQQESVDFALGPSERATVILPVAAPFDVTTGRHRADLAVTLDGQAVPPTRVYIPVPTPCQRAARPIVIDGDLDDWGSFDPIRVNAPGEGGDEARRARADLSAAAYLAWDDECFYLAARVRDNVFSEQYRGTLIWLGDSIQFAVDPLCDGGDVYQEDDYEYGLALTRSGLETWQWAGPPYKPGPAPGIRAVVTRRGWRTSYEIAVPWALLAPLSPQAGRGFGLSLLFNDDDADGEGRTYLEWGGGIAERKRPNEFQQVLLVD